MPCGTGSPRRARVGEKMPVYPPEAGNEPAERRHAGDGLPVRLADDMDVVAEIGLGRGKAHHHRLRPAFVGIHRGDDVYDLHGIPPG